MLHRLAVMQPLLGRRSLVRRLSRPVLALALLLLLGGTTYYGLTQHPIPEPPSDVEAQREIASVLSEPEGADPVLEGDLLVERFYFLDADSGQVKVADICKGRVR